MAFDFLKVYTGRALPFRHVSPAVCEGDFSSTGSPMISLLPLLGPNAPSGLVMTPHGEYFRLGWGVYPGAICYSVYKAVDEEEPFGQYTLIAECITDNYLDLDDTYDGAWVRVQAITPEGAGPLSDPILVPGGAGGDCVADEGDPAPSGVNAFDITEEKEWLTFTVVDAEIVAPYEGLPNSRTFEISGDYPPGHYDLEYVSGFRWDPVIGPEGCEPGSFSGSVSLYGLADDVCNTVAHGLYVPPSGEIINAGGWSSDCQAVPEDLEAQIAAGLFGQRWAHVAQHGNDGGVFKVVFDDYYPGIVDIQNYPDFPLVLKLIQVDGCIPQPRKLRVQLWDTKKTLFPDDVANNWDGNFPTRTTYTSTECLWTAPAAGEFEGATVYYTQTHPTAENGCGWVCEVRRGGVVYWKGYKEKNDTGEGNYLRASGFFYGPACMFVEFYE